MWCHLAVDDNTNKRQRSHLELVPPTCTSAVLEGLETGHLYQFRVYSENAAGMSDALIGPKSVRIQSGIGNFFLINNTVLKAMGHKFSSIVIVNLFTLSVCLSCVITVLQHTVNKFIDVTDWVAAIVMISH